MYLYLYGNFCCFISYHKSIILLFMASFILLYFAITEQNFHLWILYK